MITLAVDFSWVKLEWPKEVVDGLEVWTAGIDFVADVFNALDVLLAEDLVDDGVVSDSESGTFNLTITSDVNELLDHIKSWNTIGDVVFNELEGVHGGLVASDEDGVVDLSKSE